VELIAHLVRLSKDTPQEPHAGQDLHHLLRDHLVTNDWTDAYDLSCAQHAAESPSFGQAYVIAGPKSTKQEI
jgi:hypothetical protein